MSAGVSEWKPEGPTIRLGNLDNPTYDGVGAPSNIVKSASAILGGKPSKWEVNQFIDYGKQIVELTGTRSWRRAHSLDL